MNPIIPYRPFYSRTVKARKLAFIFREWDKVLARAALPLARKSWMDHPYWYKERSNIGWLTLAAHELGCVAIQEPSVNRNKGGSGRGDLWVVRGRRSYMYDFEAKETDLALSHFENGGKSPTFMTIKRLLKEAVDQLDDKDKDFQGHTATGLVFLLLYARKNIGENELVHTLRNFKQEMVRRYVKSIGADFLALHLAPYSYIRTVAKKYKEFPTPGIAIVGKVRWSVQ